MCIYEVKGEKMKETFKVSLITIFSIIIISLIVNLSDIEPVK